ncbi:hypothetical protein ACA910_007598 [Epithemia clementina (nom. ined.)]
MMQVYKHILPNSNYTSRASSSPSSSCTVNCSRPSQNIVYGHLHFMKTVGSTINGAMAATYKRVCGHKGYSYDANQFNNCIQQLRWHYNQMRFSFGKASLGGDMYQTFIKDGHSRGRIPQSIMDDIGYEDCNYISLEVPWTGWSRFDNLSS